MMAPSKIAAIEVPKSGILPPMVSAAQVAILRIIIVVIISPFTAYFH